MQARLSNFSLACTTICKIHRNLMLVIVSNAHLAYIKLKVLPHKDQLQPCLTLNSVTAPCELTKNVQMKFKLHIYAVQIGSDDCSLENNNGIKITITTVTITNSTNFAIIIGLHSQHNANRNIILWYGRSSRWFV